jgi:hypothetical protein
MCAFSSLTGADGALLHERCVLSLLTAADTPAATSFKDSIKGGEGRAALGQRLLAHKKHSSLQEEAEASFKVVRLPVVRLPATRNSEGEWRAQVVSQTELHKPQPFAKGPRRTGKHGGGGGPRMHQSLDTKTQSAHLVRTLAATRTANSHTPGGACADSTVRLRCTVACGDLV